MAGTASKFAKSLEKQGIRAREPLTPTEVRVLTANFPPPHKSLRLGTQKEIRWEMRRIYEATIRAQLPLTAATKLIYMLEKIARLGPSRIRPMKGTPAIPPRSSTFSFSSSDFDRAIFSSM